MKTIADLEHDILDITMKINTDFPELSKYITETPVKVSEKDTDFINNKDLKEYHDSLTEMVKKYSKTHVDRREINHTGMTFIPTNPLYRLLEDIEKQKENESGLNHNDLYKKAPNKERRLMKENDFDEDLDDQ
jgi:hypothetical protein